MFDSIVSLALHGLLGERIITPLGQCPGGLCVRPRCDGQGYIDIA